MSIEELREKVENEILSLEPVDYIYYMFDRTDENGIAYLPDFGKTDTRFTESEPESMRCKIDWNVDKRDRFVKKFEQICYCLKRIAGVGAELDGTKESARAILKDKNVYEVWEKYIMPFEDQVDDEVLFEILDKMEVVDDVKEIARRIYAGEEVESDYKSYLTDCIDVEITKEEEEIYQKYRSAVLKESEQRMGKKLSAYNAILFARRFTKLLELGAPNIVLRNEGRSFAQALLLNEYGVSSEMVDDLLRLNLEKIEMMTEDELDDFFRPRKTNNRKSMAPLFVYLILKEKTDVKKHLRQQDILNELKEYPYEIVIERKALSRIIHNLMDSQLAVRSDKTGVWVEQGNV